MRKASMNFKSGALYTKDGRKLADIDSGVVEWGVQVTAEAPAKSVATVARNATGTIEGKLQIGHLDVLSLMYGMRITNNWLKMHGGIMTRNGGKKKKKEIVLNKIQQIFGLDPEYNKKMEEQARQLHEKALAGKWCCTCEYCIPVDPNLPGFVTAFPECEYGGMAVETCSRYRVAGTAIRNSAWADQIRERFMRVV